MIHVDINEMLLKSRDFESQGWTIEVDREKEDDVEGEHFCQLRFVCGEGESVVVFRNIPLSKLHKMGMEMMMQAGAFLQSVVEKQTGEESPMSEP